MLVSNYVLTESPVRQQINDEEYYRDKTKPITVLKVGPVANHLRKQKRKNEENRLVP